jgi:hypothetical protein
LHFLEIKRYDDDDAKMDETKEKRLKHNNTNSIQLITGWKGKHCCHCWGLNQYIIVIVGNTLSDEKRINRENSTMFYFPVQLKIFIICYYSKNIVTKKQ